MKLVKDKNTKSYSAVVDADTKVEIGDSKDATAFKPQLKFSKWDNEVNFSMRLVTAGQGKDESSTTDTTYEKAKWNNTDLSAEFYNKPPDAEHPEGAFEFAVTLKSKPATNKLSFSVTAKDVVLYKQPPLTALVGQEGIISANETEGFNAQSVKIASRPENVVGSYAVYHKNFPINTPDGKAYRAGKVGHIYRPKAIESGGGDTWCDMGYDEQAHTLIITIPQAFLDSALYPVVVDPTFGYTTIGGTSIYFNEPGSLCHIGAGLVYTPGGGYIRVRFFNIYGSGTSYDAAVYDIAGGLPNNRLAVAVTVPFTGVNQWNSSAHVIQYMMNGTTYGMACGNANNVTVFFDTGAGNQRSQCNTNLPATWSSAGVTATLYSWYVNYEEVVPHQTKLIYDD